MPEYYVMRNSGQAVFVKEADFFEQQGGLDEAWGRTWVKINALSIEHAREIGERNLPAYPYEEQMSLYIQAGTNKYDVKTIAALEQHYDLMVIWDHVPWLGREYLNFGFIYLSYRPAPRRCNLRKLTLEEAMKEVQGE
jgi:hypothetical protein